MVIRHFRELKSSGLKVGEATRMLFGSNHGGLVAAGIWGTIFPEHQDKIVAVSCVFSVSMKIFGKHSSRRALPTARRGYVAFTEEVDAECIEHEKLSQMGWCKSMDDYSALEYKLLLQAVSCVTENNLKELEVIGKFPSNQEAIKYKLEKGKIAWMPTDNLPWFEAFMRYLRGPEPSQSTSSAAETVANISLDLEK